MIEDGLFDGLDAALMYHPCDRSHAESWPRASQGGGHRVPRHGVARVVGCVEGGNALDALIVLFTSVGLAAATQTLASRDRPPRARLGIIPA
jgi:hypothetical protein